MARTKSSIQKASNHNETDSSDDDCNKLHVEADNGYKIGVKRQNLKRRRKSSPDRYVRSGQKMKKETTRGYIGERQNLNKVPFHTLDNDL